MNGDLGVDLFFILSGFLISYLLLKEADKNDGQISYFKFLFGRITRLWFALLPAAAIQTYVSDWKSGLAAILFVSNYFGEINPYWTLAVEMQFYLFSPCIISYLYYQKNPMAIAVLMAIISTAAGFIIQFIVCPEGL